MIWPYSRIFSRLGRLALFGCLAMFLAASSLVWHEMPAVAGVAAGDTVGSEDSAASGQATANTGSARSVTLAVSVIDPLVIKTADGFEGFSIELWEEIAAGLGLATEYVEVDSVGEQIQMVASGSADAAIGAITMTEARAAEVDFAWPYLQTGNRMLAREGLRTPVRTHLSFVSSGRLWVAIGMLMGAAVTLGIGSFFVARLSRKRSLSKASKGAGDEPDAAVVETPSIWNQLAFGLDATFRRSVHVNTSIGVIMGILWLLVGILGLSRVTAMISADLTASAMAAPIENLEDVKTYDFSVVTVEGTDPATFVEQQGLQATTVSTPAEALSAIQLRESDVFIYDAPTLEHFVQGFGAGTASIVGPYLTREFYSIAVEQALCLECQSPHEPLLVDQINMQILEMRSDGRYARLRSAYFSRTTGSE